MSRSIPKDALQAVARRGVLKLPTTTYCQLTRSFESLSDLLCPAQVAAYAREFKYLQLEYNDAAERLGTLERLFRHDSINYL